MGRWSRPLPTTDDRPPGGTPQHANGRRDVGVIVPLGVDVASFARSAEAAGFDALELHYAHGYYVQDESGGDCRGLDFPGTRTPDYGDFAYFAFTLGMTFQTSDVAISSPATRRVVLLHTFAAFVFNIGVIAFTINLLGS